MLKMSWNKIVRNPTVDGTRFLRGRTIPNTNTKCNECLSCLGTKIVQTTGNLALGLSYVSSLNFILSWFQWSPGGVRNLKGPKTAN